MRGLSKRIDAEQTFEDGECIVAEGSLGRAMYIVADGRVRIVKSSGGGDVTLGYIERGDFFGEMSLLESLPRYAGAFAVGATRVLVIEPGSLVLRIRHDPTPRHRDDATTERPAEAGERAIDAGPRR